MTRLLSKQDVMKVLDMKDTIEILRRAFADLALDKAAMPQRTPITAPDYGGLALFMPAYLGGMGALGAKVVTVYKHNPVKYNIPTVLGTIILLDHKTGAPLALMDGGYLTAMRTGGVTGLATQILARGDAKVHALIGAGGMAPAQAWGVDCARNIEKIILYSIDPLQKMQALRDSLRERIGSEIVISDDPERAVREADIVTLITSAKDPVVKGEWFRPGTHINGIGSHAPAMREIDSATVTRAKVVCDLVAACKAEAGDLIIPANQGEWSWESVHGSLGDVVTGRILGREDEREITLFKSVGLAIQDISTAFHVYKMALEKGVGSDFNF